MKNRQIVLSFSRIKRHLKKSWWVLAILLVLSLSMFCRGVYFNKKSIDSQKKEFRYQKTLLFVSERLNNSYIGDFQTLLSSEEFLEIIYNGKKEKNFTIERIEGSNCLNITISDFHKKNCKKFTDKMVEEGKKYFEEIYPDIEIIELDEKYISSDEDMAVLVQMKDIIVLIMPIFLGVIGLYFLMICDDCFYERKEVEYFLEMPVYEYTEEECVNMLNKEKGTAILGRCMEMFSDIEGLEMIGLGDFLRKKEGIGINKILVIRAGKITARELEEFCNITDEDKKGSLKIFWING